MPVDTENHQVSPSFLSQADNLPMRNPVAHNRLNPAKLPDFFRNGFFQPGFQLFRFRLQILL